MENRTPESLWNDAFQRLLPKAKQMDEKALSALRNHYSPIILRAVKEFCADEGKRDLSFKRSFAKTIKNCDENMTEEAFYSALLDAVSNDLGVTGSGPVTTEPASVSTAPAKISREVRNVTETTQQETITPKPAAEPSVKETAGSSQEKPEEPHESVQESSAPVISASVPAAVKPEEERPAETKPTAVPPAAKPAELKPAEQKPSPKESEGVSKTVTIGVIAVLCAAIGIGAGFALSRQGNNNAAADPQPSAGAEEPAAETTAAPADTLSTVSEQESYDVWVVEPSLPFDRIEELSTRPEILPGINMEERGYPQSWNSDYECNAIKVEMNGAYGVYDYDGYNLIPVCLSWLDCTRKPVDFTDIFVADYYGEPYVIATDFKSIIPFVYGGIGSEPQFFYAVKDGVFGMVSLEGNRKFTKYDANTLNLSSRNAVVTVDDNCRKNGWVVTDAAGQVINGPYYNRPAGDMFLYPYINSLVSVFDYDLESTFVAESDRQIAFVNTDNGEQVTGYDYQEAKFFEDGYAPVKKNGKWGFIDENGNEVSDFIFEDASALYDGKAYVRFNGYYGIIDIRNCVVNSIPITEKTCRTENASPAYVPTDDPVISDGAIGTAVVKVNKLNIRSWGSTSAEKVGQCNIGDTFTVYEITEDSKYTWYRIGNDRWIADKDGQYLHFHEGGSDASSRAAYTDNELCEMAKRYYSSIHGQEPPIVKVEGHDGNEVIIHLYEVVNDHTATWDWYYIDRTTGKGRDFESKSIDVSAF